MVCAFVWSTARIRAEEGSDPARWRQALATRTQLYEETRKPRAATVQLLSDLGACALVRRKYARVCVCLLRGGGRTCVLSLSSSVVLSSLSIAVGGL